MHDGLYDFHAGGNRAFYHQASWLGFSMFCDRPSVVTRIALNDPPVTPILYTALGVMATPFKIGLKKPNVEISGEANPLRRRSHLSESSNH